MTHRLGRFHPDLRNRLCSHPSLKNTALDPAGKTVQTIAFCAALLCKDGSAADATNPPLHRLERIQPPSSGGQLGMEQYAPDYRMGWPLLIVCPTSVGPNWMEE